MSETQAADEAEESNENPSFEEQLWQSFEDSLSDDDDAEAAIAEDLDNYNYRQLSKVARAARAQFDLDYEVTGQKKAELIDDMAEVPIWKGPIGSSNWYAGTGAHVEQIDMSARRSSPVGSNGGGDKTVLYGLTRKETTDERIQELRDIFESTRFDLVKAGGDDFEAYSIILPAGNVEESELEDEDDDSEDEDESSDQVPRDVVRERLEEREPERLVGMAEEYDVEDAEELDTEDLIEAIMDANPDIADE